MGIGWYVAKFIIINSDEPKLEKILCFALARGDTVILNKKLYYIQELVYSLDEYIDSISYYLEEK